MFNILVVEDDAALRKMMQSVLQRNGYRTLLAEDGEAALAVLEREQADLRRATPTSTVVFPPALTIIW